MKWSPPFIMPSVYVFLWKFTSGNQTHYLAVLMPIRNHSVILFPKQCIQIRGVMSGETLCIFMAVDSPCSMLFLSVLQAWEPLTKKLCPHLGLWGQFVDLMRFLFTVGIKGLATHAYISLHHLATDAHARSANSYNAICKNCRSHNRHLFCPQLISSYVTVNNPSLSAFPFWFDTCYHWFREMLCCGEWKAEWLLSKTPELVFLFVVTNHG